MRALIECLNFRRRSAEFVAALSLLTRFPVAKEDRIQHRQSAWAWPVVGAALGASAGAVSGTAFALGAGPTVAAVLGLAAAVLMTGCLHEDGLADSADGFWGGADAERRMEIMRDSGIGAYGAAALTLILIARFAGISETIGSVSPVIVFAVTGALSRAAMLMAMRLLPLARGDGLAADCGRPLPAVAWSGCAIAVLFAGAALGWHSLAAAAAAGSAGIAVSILARRKIGGHSGDTLGAAQQTAETACLLTLAAVV